MTIRKIFLPLRKVYQLHANKLKEEQELLKKKQKAEGAGDFDEDEVLVNKPDNVNIVDPQTPQDFEAAGYRHYKAGQTLPWYMGSPQGRAGAGGDWVDPATSRVHGRQYDATAEGMLPELGNNFREMIMDLTSPVTKFIKDYIFTPFVKGSSTVFKPISKVSGKVFNVLQNSVMKNFAALSIFTGAVAAATTVLSYLEETLYAWAREWEQFSPELLAAKAAEGVKTVMSQMEAARRTGGVMATNARIQGKMERTLIDIKSTLVDTFMPLVNGALRLLQPILDAVKIIVGLVGIVLKPIFVIVDLLASLVEWLLTPVQWIADSVQGLYDTTVRMFEWMRGITKDMKNLEALDPMFDMMGVDMDLKEFMKKAGTTTKRRSGLPGMAR